MKIRVKININEDNYTARALGIPTLNTIAKIRTGYHLTQIGNPMDKGSDKIDGPNGIFKIRPMEDLEDRIYVRWDGDCKVNATCYAVFKKTNYGWHQVTDWYGYFGVARRHMMRLAYEHR